MASTRHGLAFLLRGIALLLVVLSATPAGGQSQEQTRLLEVRRRQQELQAARRRYEQTVKLANEGVVSQNEVERERNGLNTAQLNYQQSVLGLFDFKARLSVRSAVKTQTSDGRQFVRLTIGNLTPAFDDSQFQLLNNFEGAEPIPEQLRSRTVNDIFVSLRDSGAPAPGADANRPPGPSITISLPYEIRIPQLKYGETQTLSYQLLRDVDSVVVTLYYHNQTQEVPIQLQRVAGGSNIQMSSTQSSQEANFGGEVTYAISLERPTVDVRSFQLRVVNLPSEVSYSFVDPESQARISQINFPAGITRQTLGLKLFLPAQGGEQFVVDQPLTFWALALDDATASRFAQERTYKDTEISAAGAGKVKLALIPRGVGGLEVVGATLFSEIATGQSAETKFALRNTGTRRLTNVKLTAEHPLNWQAVIEPNIIPVLDLNGEATVTLKIVPPPDVAVGDYEVRIKPEALIDNRRVGVEEKTYRVSIKPRESMRTTAAMIGGLILLAVGVIAAGMKLTRR